MRENFVNRQYHKFWLVLKGTNEIVTEKRYIVKEKAKKILQYKQEDAYPE
jgi:hypothetical protein